MEGKRGRSTLFPAVTCVAPTAVTYGHDAGNWATKLELDGFPKTSVPFATRHPCDCEYATPPSPDETTIVMPASASCESQSVQMHFDEAQEMEIAHAPCRIQCTGVELRA